MLFAIIGRDVENSKEKRPNYRKNHLERLKKLEKEGKLILAGPFSDSSGSLIIIEASSIEEAKVFAENDPYYVNGIFKNVEIKPFNKVLPSS